MKKLGVLSVAFLSVLLLSNVASAASYWFSDTADNWCGDLVAEDYLALDFDWDTTDSSGTYTTQDEFLTAGIYWLNDDGLQDETFTGMNGFGTAWQCWGWPFFPWPLFPWPPKDSPAPVPEPSTMILLGMGVLGIAGTGRKKIFKNK